MGGVDESDVAEGLRHIAQHPARDGVVLLAEQPDVVAQTQQPVEQRLCVVMVADQRQTLDQPERADQEKGKANAAIVSVLCDQLNLAPSQVAVIAGETSRQKKLLVTGISNDELQQRIAGKLDRESP